MRREVFVRLQFSANRCRRQDRRSFRDIG